MNSFEIYLGIVAEDKLYNTTLTKIFIKELFPFYKSNLKDLTSVETVEIYNNDVLEKIDVITSNVITAEYYNLSANRAAAPDLRKGERVLVFKYFDIDQFYYIPVGLDQNLRRLEFLRFQVSDDKKSVKILDDDNTYFIELDTLHSKTITISTSKSDNEAFRYKCQIDAIANTVTIKDDDSNSIKLDSNIPKIIAENKHKTKVEINDKDIFIENHKKSKINIIDDLILIETLSKGKVKIEKDDILATNNTGAKVNINPAGIITIQDSSGFSIVLSNGSIVVTSPSGSSISIDESGGMLINSVSQLSLNSSAAIKLIAPSITSSVPIVLG